MKPDDLKRLRSDRLLPTLGDPRRLLRRRRGLGPLGWGLILLGYGLPAVAFAVVTVIVPESHGQHPTDSPAYQLGWIALPTGTPAALLGLFLTLMESLARFWTRAAARRADDSGAPYAAREAARSRAIARARGRAALVVAGLGFAVAEIGRASCRERV